MSFDNFNSKAHIMRAAREDARIRERPSKALLSAMQARFGESAPATNGHYKDATKMALGHNKSNGPRRR